MYYDDRNLFFNKIWQGVLIGIAVPILFFVLYYLYRFRQFDFAVFIQSLIKSGKLVNVMSLSVLPNLIPFMLFINSNRYSSGRGVLASTIILGIIVFILKLV